MFLSATTEEFLSSFVYRRRFTALSYHFPIGDDSSLFGVISVSDDDSPFWLIDLLSATIRHFALSLSYRRRFSCFCSVPRMPPRVNTLWDRVLIGDD
jgi:hypothetical protein